MVGFGSSLRMAHRSGWEGSYLDYETLKLLLSQIEAIYEEEGHNRNRRGRNRQQQHQQQQNQQQPTDYREELFLESDSEEAYRSVDAHDSIDNFDDEDDVNIDDETIVGGGTSTNHDHSSNHQNNSNGNNNLNSSNSHHHHWDHHPSQIHLQNQYQQQQQQQLSSSSSWNLGGGGGGLGGSAAGHLLHRPQHHRGASSSGSVAAAAMNSNTMVAAGGISSGVLVLGQSSDEQAAYYEDGEDDGDDEDDDMGSERGCGAGVTSSLSSWTISWDSSYKYNKNKQQHQQQQKQPSGYFSFNSNNMNNNTNSGTGVVGETTPTKSNRRRTITSAALGSTKKRPTTINRWNRNNSSNQHSFIAVSPSALNNDELGTFQYMLDGSARHHQHQPGSTGAMSDAVFITRTPSTAAENRQGDRAGDHHLENSNRNDDDDDDGNLTYRYTYFDQIGKSDNNNNTPANAPPRASTLMSASAGGYYDDENTALVQVDSSTVTPPQQQFYHHHYGGGSSSGSLFEGGGYQYHQYVQQQQRQRSDDSLSLPKPQALDAMSPTQQGSSSTSTPTKKSMGAVLSSFLSGRKKRGDRDKDKNDSTDNLDMFQSTRKDRRRELRELEQQRKKEEKAKKRQQRQQMERRRRRRRLAERRRRQRLRRESKVPRHLRIAHAKARAITERFLGLLRAETEKVLLFAQARLGELADTAGTLRFPMFDHDGDEYSHHHRHHTSSSDVAGGGTAEDSTSAHEHHHHGSASYNYPWQDGGMHPSASSSSEEGNGLPMGWTDSSSDEETHTHNNSNSNMMMIDSSQMMGSGSGTVVGSGGVSTKNRVYSSGGFSDDTALRSNRAGVKRSSTWTSFGEGRRHHQTKQQQEDDGTADTGVRRGGGGGGTSGPSTAMAMENSKAVLRQIMHFERLRKDRSVFQRCDQILGEDMLFLSAVEEADGYTAVGVELMHVLKFICLNTLAVRRICRKHDRLLMNRMLGGYYQRTRLPPRGSEGNNNTRNRKSDYAYIEDARTLGGLVAKVSGDIYEAHPALIGEMNHYKLVGIYDRKVQKLANSRTVQVVSSCLALALSEYEIARSRANALSMMNSSSSLDIGNARGASDDECPDEAAPSTASSISLTRLRFTVTSIFALREAARFKLNYFSTYLARSMLTFTGQPVVGEGLDGCSRKSLDFLVAYNPDAALLLHSRILFEGLKRGQWMRLPMSETMTATLAAGTTPNHMTCDVATELLSHEIVTVGNAVSVIPESKNIVMLKRFVQGQLGKKEAVRPSVISTIFSPAALRLHCISCTLYAMNYYIPHATSNVFLLSTETPTAYCAAVIGVPNLSAIIVGLIHCQLSPGESSCHHGQVTMFRWLFVLSSFMGLVGNIIYARALDQGFVEMAIVGRFVYGFSSVEILHRQILLSCTPTHVVSESARLVQHRVLGMILGLSVGSLTEVVPIFIKSIGVRSLQSSSWLMMFLWFVHLIYTIVQFRSNIGRNGSGEDDAEYQGLVKVPSDVADSDSSSSSDQPETPPNLLFHSSAAAVVERASSVGGTAAMAEVALATESSLSSTTPGLRRTSSEGSIACLLSSNATTEAVAAATLHKPLILTPPRKSSSSPIGEISSSTIIPPPTTAATPTTPTPTTPCSNSNSNNNNNSARKRGRCRQLKSFVVRIRRWLSYHVGIRISLVIIFYVNFVLEALFASSPIIAYRYFHWTGSRTGFFLIFLTALILPINFACELVSRRYEERTVMRRSANIIGVGLFVMFNWISMFSVAKHIPKLFDEMIGQPDHSYDWRFGILQFVIGLTIAFVGLISLNGSATALLSKIASAQLLHHTGTISMFWVLLARLLGTVEVWTLDQSHRVIYMDIVNSLVVPFFLLTFAIAFMVKKHFFFLM